MTASAQILIVDDNPVNLKLASAVLEAAGYELLHASDAEEALAILEHKRPRLILMDIALPGMDGLALTHHLKSDDRTRHILVVALTAFAMKGDDERARAAGCDGYITKPINTRQLPELVAEFLRPPKSSGTNNFSTA